MAVQQVIGGVNLLVYLECPCGRACAIPEGGYFPRCGECGELYVPGGGGPATADEPAMFGVLDGDATATRAMRSLGYVGVLMPEANAAKARGFIAQALGLDVFRAGAGERIFSRAEQERYIRTRAG